MLELDLPAGLRRARVGDLQLAYETFGDPGDVPVLLIMGLGGQMLEWPDEFCELLAARGHNVVRYDNRDVGLSTHLDLPPADLQAALSGDLGAAPYTLSDMAADAAGLLDALGLESAHVVGVSMGGMIAQTLAIEHPERVRSLTSIMSTTGDRAVGVPTPEAFGVLGAPPARTREEAQERAVAALRVIGSPGFERDDAAVRDQAGRAFDRANDPAGASRHLAAIILATDRTERLRGLRAPTLVVHGAEDPLVGVSGGRATAAAVPGARLEVIEGMGHDLTRGTWPRIVDLVVELVARVEHARTGA